jgi:hypothetical protein
MAGLVLIPTALWTLWLALGSRTKPAVEETDLNVVESS